MKVALEKIVIEFSEQWRDLILPWLELAKPVGDGMTNAISPDFTLDFTRGSVFLLGLINSYHKEVADILRDAALDSSFETCRTSVDNLYAQLSGLHSELLRDEMFQYLDECGCLLGLHFRKKLRTLLDRLREFTREEISDLYDGKKPSVKRAPLLLDPSTVHGTGSLFTRESC